jgi:hypothetical protein
MVLNYKGAESGARRKKAVTGRGERKGRGQVGYRRDRSGGEQAVREKRKTAEQKTTSSSSCSPGLRKDLNMRRKGRRRSLEEAARNVLLLLLFVVIEASSARQVGLCGAVGVG